MYIQLPDGTSVIVTTEQLERVDALEDELQNRYRKLPDNEMRYCVSAELLTRSGVQPSMRHPAYPDGSPSDFMLCLWARSDYWFRQTTGFPEPEWPQFYWDNPDNGLSMADIFAEFDKMDLTEGLRV